MSYFHVEDFRWGMDRRRPQVAGIPGTLWTLKNGVISRGGDVFGAKKWVPVHSLPSGTHGLAALRNQLYVFGHGDAPEGIPAGVNYVKLEAPGTPNMARVADVKAFDGKLYVSAEYSDDKRYHFYDGVRVIDWDADTGSSGSFARIAERFGVLLSASDVVSAAVAGSTITLTGKTPGVAFTIDSDATDGGEASTPTADITSIQAAAAGAPEVKATATLEVNFFNTLFALSIFDIELPLLDEWIFWAGSGPATAVAIRNSLNSGTATHGCTATSSGAVVTITAPAGYAASANGFELDVITDTVGGVELTPFSGGAPPGAPVAQISKVVISGGSFDPDDSWEITIDDVDYLVEGGGIIRPGSPGAALYVTKRRVYSVSDSLVRYSALNDATHWVFDGEADPPDEEETGPGFINVSMDSEGAQNLVAMAQYDDLTAIFADNNVLTYDLRADATQNALVSTVENTGAFAHRAAVSFGNSDVFYPTHTGIRSLRSRDQSGAPYVTDIGSAIDTFYQESLAGISAFTQSRAVAAIEPTDGRYMLAVGNRVFVLSYFPSAKITAWSYFDLGFAVTDFATDGRRLYARGDDDKIYVYGGLSGDVYPGVGEQITEIETPFMTAKDPAGVKLLRGFDVALSGVWDIDVLVDPNDPAKVRKVDPGTIYKTTYAQPHIPIPGRTSHMALRMTSASAGLRTLSSVALHYEKDSAK